MNIILKSLLIQPYGMYGAGIATELSVLLQVFLHFIITSRMKQNQFQMSILSFLPWLLAIITATGVFFAASNLWLLRWGIGIALGVYEFCKVIKRKSVF